MFKINGVVVDKKTIEMSFDSIHIDSMNFVLENAIKNGNLAFLRQFIPEVYFFLKKKNQN